MATLTVQQAGFNGLADIVFSAASAGGDDFPNDGNTILLVENANTTSKTVTINSQAPCSQGFDHDIQVVVVNGDTATIGTFPKSRFNDNNGSVLVTYSAVTAVSVAAVSV